MPFELKVALSSKFPSMLTLIQEASAPPKIAEFGPVSWSRGLRLTFKTKFPLRFTPPPPLDRSYSGRGILPHLKCH